MTPKIMTQYTVSDVFLLHVGGIYTSYAVSVKPRKYPRTYRKIRIINVVKHEHAYF